MRSQTLLLALLFCTFTLGCGDTKQSGSVDTSTDTVDAPSDIADTTNSPSDTSAQDTANDLGQDTSTSDTMSVDSAVEDTEPSDDTAAEDTEPVEDSALEDTEPVEDAGLEDTTPIEDTAPEEDTAPLPIKGPLLIDGPDVATANNCITLWVSAGAFTNKNFEVELSGEGGGFYEDMDCTIPIESLTLGPEMATVSVSAKATGPGPAVLSAAATEWESAQHTLDVPANTYAVDERVDEVLVVYNTNSEGALDIATYYAEKRGIALERICPVSLPRGLFATPQQLLGARQQILTCLCAIDEDAAPATCNPEGIDALLPTSPITHLALIRGIPARMTGTPWGTDNEEPAFDYYLSYLLANDVDIFEDGSLGTINIPYNKTDIPDDMRDKLDPATHKAFAIGRIEAITVERTLDLIDRTLASEAAGFEGRIVSEARLNAFAHKNPGRYFTSTFNSDCLDYLSNEPFEFNAPTSSWPDACRWGTTGTTLAGAEDGLMPGQSNTTVPKAVNVTWFTGTNPITAEGKKANNHNAFYNYDTMKNWRKTFEPCNAECDDFELEADKLACEESSTDYFKVLNTDCVGVAPGFMGQQIRSYPVGFYGFFPHGWARGGGGGSESTPPEHRVGGAFNNEDFADDHYLHFGKADHQAPNQDTCESAEGESIDCNEIIAINLLGTFTLPEPLTVTEDVPVELTFRYRTQGGAISGLRTNLYGCKGYKCFNAHKTVDNKWPITKLKDEQLSWTEAKFTIAIKPQEETSEINKIRLWFDGRFMHQNRGFFDIDGIEVHLVETGELLLSESFTNTKNRRNTQGASAADVIDRMGGIAYWGSSSHHLTGGWAWNPTTAVARNLFGGRTLGESLVRSSAKSGIFYGDPLYRGYAAKITNTDNDSLSIPLLHTLYVDDPPEISDLILNTLHGTALVHDITWELAQCALDSLEACEGQWTTVLKGVGAVRGHHVSVDTLWDAIGETKSFLRLRVTRPEDWDGHVSSYAKIRIMGPGWTAPVGCVADFTGDGLVTALDVQSLMPLRVCDADKLKVDYNGDNQVNANDAAILSEAIPSGDLAYDLNGDGVLDGDDVLTLLTFVCGMKWKGNGDNPFDLNDDGVVDDLDLEIIEQYVGIDDCACTLPPVNCPN